jgi:hypothetical protein
MLAKQRGQQTPTWVSRSQSSPSFSTLGMERVRDSTVELGEKIQ